MEKKQFREIDLCRGLGIILVVLGHALKQTGTDHQAVHHPASAKITQAWNHPESNP